MSGEIIWLKEQADSTPRPKWKQGEESGDLLNHLSICRPSEGPNHRLPRNWNLRHFLREVKALRQDLFPPKPLCMGRPASHVVAYGLAAAYLTFRPVLPRLPHPIKIRCICGLMPKSSRKRGSVQHCSQLIALLAQHGSGVLAPGVHASRTPSVSGLARPSRPSWSMVPVSGPVLMKAWSISMSWWTVIEVSQAHRSCACCTASCHRLSFTSRFPSEIVEFVPNMR